MTGPIDLVDPPIFKLCAELAQGAKVLGENDRPGRRPVQPMRHAEVNLVRTVAAAQVRLDAHFQAVDPRRGLRQDARRLVDHQARRLVRRGFESMGSTKNRRTILD